MLTESEARELLAEAAATIDVPPGEPVVAPPRRVSRWVPVVVAAAVLAVVVGVLAVLDRPDGSDPVAPPPTPAEPQGSVIPSVFAYDATSAEQMLADLGLDVSIRYKQTCDDPGRAVRTRPAAGTQFEPGDPVALTVTKIPPAARCMPARDASTWELLDFANGRGTAPVFADKVSVFLNGELTTLTGTQAADPAAWPDPSALGVLAIASNEVQVMGDNWLTPHLTVRAIVGSDEICGGPVLPEEIADPPSSGFVIELPSDEIGGPCTFGAVASTEGKIDTVVVRSSAAWTGGSTTPPDPVAADVGEAFLSFARDEGGDPDFATRVRLYLGNEFQKTVDDPTDRAAWNMCAAYAEASCPFSALATLRENDVADEFLTRQERSFCLQELAAPSDYPEGQHVVVLTPPEPATCMDDFAVQVFYDDAGQVAAVNLLLGSP